MMWKFRLLAGITLSGLTLLASRADAELSQAYENLLHSASINQTDTEFLATAVLVAGMSETGPADVLALVHEHLPDKLHLFADWDVQAMTAAAADSEAPGHRSLDATPVDLAEAPDGSGGWFARALNPSMPENWIGRVSIAVQLEQGNSDLTDIALGLEIDRELEEGWQVDTRLAYSFSETNAVKTRDDWLFEGRLARTNEDGLGYYLGGTYEDNQVSLFDVSAFATAGVIWHAVDREGLNWILRGGGGARFRRDRDPSVPDTWDEVVEGGSSLKWLITDLTSFESETTGYAGATPRINQDFVVRSTVIGHWAMETALRVSHEFESEPGLEPTQSAFTFGLSRAF